MPRSMSYPQGFRISGERENVLAMNANRHENSGPSRTQQITLRGPAELADALPFMLGFHPTDSVVLVGLHGERGRFGGRVRLGIPSSPREWASTADHLAECLVEGGARSGARPDGVVVFLCQDPAPGETGRHVMERLRPFSQRLRTACGALDIPVYEVLCISDGLYFSYCCPDARCCPPDGTPLALSGTTVMAATAAYAGMQVRGTLRDMEARLKPAGGPGEEEQRAALDAAAASIVPRILEGSEEQGRVNVREETLRLAREILRRFANPKPLKSPKSAKFPETAMSPETRTASKAPKPSANTANPPGVTIPGRNLVDTSERDAADDALITPEEAAALILGLQDRVTGTVPPNGWKAGRAPPPCGSGAYWPGAVSPPTRSTPPRPSPSWAGRPGPPATSRRPGSPSGSRSAPIPNTSSPSCSTRRATRASTPNRSAPA